MTERLYRLLARLYPKEIQRYVDDMWAVVARHRDMLVDRGERQVAGRTWAFILRDMLRTLPATHLTAWRMRGRAKGNDFRKGRGEGRMGTGGLGLSWLDVKLGVRMLAKHPGLTLVAVFALAIGIPVGLAPTHYVDAVEAPLPVEAGERIRGLRLWNVATSRPEETTLHDLVRWRESLTTFEALGASRLGSYNVESEDGLAPPVRGVELTSSSFDMLRVPPLLGRTLDPADEVIGAPDVVVIGADLWQSRLDGDPAIIGRAIRIGAVQHTVVGVMPEEFRFPVSQQLWLPLREQLGDQSRAASPLRIYGRLPDGTSPEEAQAELIAVGYRSVIDAPDMQDLLQPEVVPFGYIVFTGRKGGIRAMPEFYFIQMLTLFLLVVACTNVGLLIFARTATRSAEIAVRTALGASRRRIISQVFTESLVLAVAAAGAGLVLMECLPKLIPIELADELPYWIDFGVTGSTVAWALSLSALSAGVAGVLPALRVTGRSVQRNIQRATAGRSGIRFGGVTSALIVADVAIAVSVVGLAGGMTDMLKEAWNAKDRVGIEAEQFLAAEVRLSMTEPETDANGDDFVLRMGETQQALVERLKAEPDVRAVAVASSLPRMQHRQRTIEVDGGDQSGGFVSARVRMASVDVDFFPALDSPILIGRGFTAADLHDEDRVVIVNTSFVDHVLNGRNPIGQRVRYQTTEDGQSGPWFEIVGVVGHLGMHMLDPDRDQGLYLPMAPGEINPVQLAIQVGTDPQSFTPRLRVLANEVDPTAVIAGPTALDRVAVGDWYIGVAMTVGGVFLVVILLALAASGVYAIMSFTVAERTKEIGLRAALGAGNGNIAYMIAKRSLAQLALGVLLGMPVVGRLYFEAASGSTAPILTAFLVALGLGLVVLILIGLLACAAPTARALRIMPTEALREGG